MSVLRSYIPYAELDCKQRGMVDSEYVSDRSYAAEQGWGIDKLVADASFFVRKAVAEGNYDLSPMKSAAAAGSAFATDAASMTLQRPAEIPKPAFASPAQARLDALNAPGPAVTSSRPISAALVTAASTADEDVPLSCWKLKSCPFCKGSARLERTGGLGYAVRCEICGASAVYDDPDVSDMSENMRRTAAAAKWNMRATGTARGEEVHDS